MNFLQHLIDTGRVAREEIIMHLPGDDEYYETVGVVLPDSVVLFQANADTDECYETWDTIVLPRQALSTILQQAAIRGDSEHPPLERRCCPSVLRHRQAPYQPPASAVLADHLPGQRRQARHRRPRPEGGTRAAESAAR